MTKDEITKKIFSDIVKFYKEGELPSYSWELAVNISKRLIEAGVIQPEESDALKKLYDLVEDCYNAGKSIQDEFKSPEKPAVKEQYYYIWANCEPMDVPEDKRDRLVLDFLANVIPGHVYLVQAYKFQQGTEYYLDTGEPTGRKKYRLV